MSNMLDYLAWRGDLPLALSPLNDVDSLIFAVLSYLDFPAEPTLLRDLSVPELPAAAWRRPTFLEDSNTLLKRAAATERFAGVGIRRAAAVTDPDRDMQFAAVTFALPDGTHYVAFRGTDSSLAGWHEDFNMAFESPVPAQSAAVAYLNAIAAETDGPLLLGGHSKGGNLAVYAAAHADEATQARIHAVYSFDGPGLDDATMASEGYARIARRIRSFIPQQSVVGLLMSYHPEYTVVRSDGVGLMQHNGFTWQVLGTGFVAVTELDVSSQVVDSTVHAWLSRVSPEQRRRFVSIIFGVLEATGANTTKELLQRAPELLPAIHKTLQGVDRETTRMIFSLWGQFVQIGASNILDLLRQRLLPETNETLQGETSHDE